MELMCKAKSIMLNNIRACSHLSSENRIERIEMPLARLILTVSHLDEEWDLEGMKVRARYVFSFFLLPHLRPLYPDIELS
jgi:hypothetical protein